MTLLTIEGFETRSAKSGWTISNLTWATGRFGGTASQCASGMLYSLPAATDVVVTGFALQLPTSATLRRILSGYDAATTNPQWAVTLRADKYLDITRGSTSPVVASSTAPIGAGGEWVWMEVKARTNDTTGFVEVKVNGAVVASYTGDTITTTQAGSNNGTTMLSWESTTSMTFDDIYVLDTVGPAPYNDYLGEIQVETLVPNGNGATNQFVGTDGNSVDNYLLVDELPAVDTDNVASSTAGQRDLYAFTDPNIALGTILAVQSNVAVSKILAGPATVKVVERLSTGVERVGSAKPVSNLLYRSELSVTDPSGAAWLPATVAGLQAGAEVG